MNTYEQQNITLDGPMPVSMISAEKRATFLKRVYLHVAFAFLGFVGVEFILYSTGLFQTLLSLMTSSNLVLMGIMFGFMFAEGAVQKWAHKATDKKTQYIALSVYAAMYAVFFIPMIGMAISYLGVSAAISDILLPAGMVTIGLFAALVTTVFISGKDFSFLKAGITIGSFIALGVIAMSFMFDMDLGAWFSIAMIVLMAGAILYQTSQILKRYHEEQYIMASVSVFASFMTLLFYVLRLFMSRD